MRTVSITPSVSFSNTLQTTNKDGVNTDTFIPAASLQNGVKYLVLYSASYGSKKKNHKVGIRLQYGNTVLGRAFDKGINTKGSNPRGVSSLSGFYILTGDGVSDLRLKFSRKKGTVYAISKGLVAIPLSGLKENEDYFYIQQNGDAAETTTTEKYVSLIDTSLKLPEMGSYVVLMSAEGFIPKRGRKTDGEGFRFCVDGIQHKPDTGKSWKLNNASRSYAYAKLHQLPAGIRNFKIEVGPIQGKSSKSFRRGRIIVIRASAFDQTLAATKNTPQAASDAYQPLISNNYTPNRQEYLIAVSNSWVSHAKAGLPVYQNIRNTTDSTDWVKGVTDIAERSAVDKSLLTNFVCEQVDTQKTYELQVSGEMNPSVWQYGDFVMISLTSTPTDTVLLPDSDGSSQGTWTIVGGTSSVADTVDMSDSDATYVWLDNAVVGDFVDLKLDKVSGVVNTQTTDPVILEFRARSLVDEKECELTVAVYEGDPAVSGTLINSHAHTLSETQFEAISQTFDWSAFRSAVTNFNNLYVRISVTDITGSGNAPDPAISLVSLSLPGKTSKNVVMNSAVEATDGQTYVVYDQNGKQYRKVKYLAEQEGWTDRNGVPLETPEISIVAYEVEES